MNVSSRFIGLVFAACTALLSPCLAEPSSVTIWFERSISPSGPWERVDLNSVPKDALGNPRFPTDGRHFFRTRIELGASGEQGLPVPVATIPREFTDRAQAILRVHLDENTEDPEGWPEDVELAEDVHVHESILLDGTLGISHFEFKVTRRPPAPDGDGGFELSGPERPDSLDAGYILISLTEDDFPVPEYATTGPTVFERLANLAGTSNIRVMRYGPTFYVAEDEDGALLASQGSTPFKLDPKIFDMDGAEWQGDSDTGMDVEPANLPELEVEHYRSYAEFKADFATNPTYQRVREIMAARARVEWEALRGVFPEVLRLAPGASIAILRGENDPDSTFEFSTEDEAAVRVTFPGSGGAVVYGAAEGEGVLRVRIGSVESLFEVIIENPLGPRDFVPLNSPTEINHFWYAGTWAMQPKYDQFARSQWCNLTGCGPVAWAILFAWYDIHRGVEHAFRGEGVGKNPPMDTYTFVNRQQVLQAYNELHDLCDVICSPFSQQGGTWPTSMTSAFKGYTWFHTSIGALGRQWHTNSITGTWPGAAFRSRDAVMAGRPAVTGLGFFWHYVVAYGYQYKQITFPGGQKFVGRYIKCNMGWGNSVAWYNLNSTFYATNVRLWAGQNANAIPGT